VVRFLSLEIERIVYPDLAWCQRDEETSDGIRGHGEPEDLGHLPRTAEHQMRIPYCTKEYGNIALRHLD
jgi:hypothetical protein